jgi:hypothetical protein
MERITRNVRDLRDDERQVYEAALGAKLRENQQIVLEVVTAAPNVAPDGRAGSSEARQPASPLPEWCNVYDGLSQDEIAELENVILDRDGWARDAQET